MRAISRVRFKGYEGVRAFDRRWISLDHLRSPGGLERTWGCFHFPLFGGLLILMRTTEPLTHVVTAWRSKHWTDPQDPSSPWIALICECLHKESLSRFSCHVNCQSGLHRGNTSCEAQLTICSNEFMLATWLFV
ncbi:hypothetical protein CONLIGDRAFT_413295 [Coniochaeta ligniaria NRRL 30616]|uniref:Uncharacterized protein n=1 Tax=Coniochaeta ligniaria NRRL 30616 TaxID=1408157 RepID=A0A1J7IPZ8_9PEZI|nr:hypothetical protein CONLIGDRAFT_413295 [Coniochaeta ligniaria NRRL 30616]